MLSNQKTNVMKILSWLLLALLPWATLSATGNKHPGSGKTMHQYMSHYENVLGTSLEIKISAASPHESAAAERAILEEISRISKILSAYDPGSEFSQWLKTSGEPIHVSPELFE